MIYEIDDTAKELIQTLCDLDIPNIIAVQALCKAIVMIAAPEDLDNACRWIDEYAEKEP
jgi:hypothetical protein